MAEKDYHYTAGDLKKEQVEMNRIKEAEEANIFTEVGDMLLTIFCC